VKNRVHLDLHVGADARAATVERLTKEGGTVLWDGQQGGSSWVTMADPEGNEFCVA
jgi:predicted enzyme related to lactoylglutathione lyase